VEVRETSISEMKYYFIGTDPACENGTTTPYACGVHVHVGVSCEEPAGGLFFQSPVETDPWATVNYMHNTDGVTTGTVTDLMTGYSGEETVGRVVAVHDATGAPVACSTLMPVYQNPLTATNWGPYPGYSSNLAISGTWGPMTTSGVTQTYAYDFSGTDPRCVNGADPANAVSCGMHVHVGMTCETAEAIGGLFSKGVVTETPWLVVNYVSDATGNTEGTVTVMTGATQSEMVGHAVVVHDYDGAGISCAILEMVSCPEGCLPMTSGQEYRRARKARKLLFSSAPGESPPSAPSCPAGCMVDENY